MPKIVTFIVYSVDYDSNTNTLIVDLKLRFDKHIINTKNLRVLLKFTKYI